MSSRGWYGVDLDGTLAHYVGWQGASYIGAPIPLMLKHVKDLLAEGKEVRIFTARVWHDGSEAGMLEAMVAREAIEGWCLKHLGVKLQVTNIKDYGMVELWDDRARGVRLNEGTFI